MFCPRCGGKLQQLERKVFPYNDEWWDLDGKEQEKYLEAQSDYESCQREEYECLGNKCFQIDFPLYFHHPIKGIDSAPGDSWSLSWVK